MCACGVDASLGPWVPFYHPAKVALVAWLAFPQTLGAEFLLQKYLEPRLATLWPETRETDALSYTEFRSGKTGEGNGYTR